MPQPISIQSPGSGHSPVQLREVLDDAIRYWEQRRVAYNIILVVVVAGWLVSTWPHFRSALSPSMFLVLFILAVLANVGYCAAYLADIPMQYSSFRPAWQRKRWVLWLMGTVFATVLANYWIADEIYPFVR